MPTYSNPFAHAQPAPNPLSQTQGSFNPHPRPPLRLHRRLTKIIRNIIMKPPDTHRVKNRSADWQSAVSPNGIRRGVAIDDAFKKRPNPADRQSAIKPSATRRSGRVASSRLCVKKLWAQPVAGWLRLDSGTKKLIP
jgi:hypothetical protein